jgi:L-lactate dehydrogenase
MVGSSTLAHFSAQLGRTIDAAARARIDEAVRGAAYRIIAGKGATWFGIGAALARIVQAIGGDERAVLTVSGETAALGRVALSLPRIVGRAGAGPGIMPELAQDERAALGRSAEIVAAAIASTQI